MKVSPSVRYLRDNEKKEGKKAYPGGAWRISKSLLSTLFLASMESWSTGLSLLAPLLVALRRASKAGESPVEGMVDGYEGSSAVRLLYTLM